MQHSTVIESKAMFFSDLFHQGRFTVPWHQRYYDWKVDDVRALLHDIDEAVKEERDCYFLGAVMLVKVGPRQWEINDGQQRMVTISLICAVLCRRFAREGDSQREGLALRMLFDLDDRSAWTLDDAELYTPRVSPPRNDAMRYRQMIRGNTIGTNGMLNAAWDEIENYFSSLSRKIAEQHFDFLLGKLEVACLWVPRKIDPNAVYETINCRGKKLDDVDLIRNFLYSHFNTDSDSERRISVHENLERIRGLIPNLKKASEYMRCCLQCRFGFLGKDNFYRDVREAVRIQRDKKHGTTEPTSDYAFELTRQITSNESLKLFRMMTATNPSPDFIKTFESASGTRKSPRNLAVFIRELQGYTVTQPLVFALLARYIRESDGRKKRVVAKLVNKNLSRLATFVLRTAFVAPKFEPSHFETEFSNYAKKIMAVSNVPDDEFAAFLRDCDRAEYGVLEDSKFRNDMAEKKMTGATKIKQFLLGINSIQQRDARLLNGRLCTIEHILPKSPHHWSGWPNFKDVDGTDWVQRIGNLTLMGPTDNKPGDKYNAAFAKKRASYGESSLAITRELEKFNDWNPHHIEARQLDMVKQAVLVWTFA